MRTAPAAAPAHLAHPRERHPRRHGPLIRLEATRLDRELASGTAAWQSRLHAARSLQLTSRRARTAIASALERLAADAARPDRARGLSAAVTPCTDQVREAIPMILEISARLRAGTPVDGRGTAALRLLLSDGSGPCYVRIHRLALRDALAHASRSLEARE